FTTLEPASRKLHSSAVARYCVTFDHWWVDRRCAGEDSIALIRPVPGLSRTRPDKAAFDDGVRFRSVSDLQGHRHGGYMQVKALGESPVERDEGHQDTFDPVRPSWCWVLGLSAHLLILSAASLRVGVGSALGSAALACVHASRGSIGRKPGKPGSLWHADPPITSLLGRDGVSKGRPQPST
ncbi:hypothetical protein THAOC_17972, partial [Thalassiosira oceanica]